MKIRTLVLIIILIYFFSLIFWPSCLLIDTKSITLKGTIYYDNYLSGKILIRVCEEWSQSPAQFGCGGTGITPGECVSEKILDGPGNFEISARIKGKTDIEFLVYPKICLI